VLIPVLVCFHAIQHGRRVGAAWYTEDALRLGPQFAGNIAAQGLPAPLLLAYLTFFTEFVAATCLALGLFTRIAALMIWIEMAIIIAYFNGKYGYFWTARGFEYALLWLLLCTAIFFRGGGRYSFDRLIGKEF
jgi:putative oxidoreductase